MPMVVLWFTVDESSAGPNRRSDDHARTTISKQIYTRTEVKQATQKVVQPKSIYACFFRFPPFVCRPSSSFSKHSSVRLRELLLDEESPQIAQLPRARNSQDRKLQQRPSHDPAVDALADVSELGLALSLENLLALDVLQAGVQVADLLDHVLDLVLVRALDFGGVADCHIELEFDPAGLRAVEEEARGCGHVSGREAETVVAGVGGCEDEFAAGGGALGDDAVVVVEGFVNGYEDAL
jgi:hypothetical protein